MSEPDQCIICLDSLPRLSDAAATAAPVHGEASSDAAPIAPPIAQDDASYLHLVAALDGCDHTIHDACIRSWAQKTNTCPICRNVFHNVKVYNGLDGTAVSTYAVEDKKQVAEFDFQQWLGENPEEEDVESTPCPICNSADREEVLLLCDSCDAAYHTDCLGLEGIPPGDWYCMECAHLFHRNNEPEGLTQPTRRPQRARQPRRSNGRTSRGPLVRTVARRRRARQQARNVEWQGAWGQFSGRFYEMSDLDLDNLDGEDEDLEQFRRFQQIDRLEVDQELRRWQQRMDIARRLGARDTFVSNIPHQISERLQATPPPPVLETPEEKKAWGALELARETEDPGQSSTRKRKARSVTASPAEPVQEPERKLKRPRTRRLPTQSEASTSVSSPAAAAAAGSSSGTRATNSASNGTSRPSHQNGVSRADDPPLVSSLLRELEPHAGSDDESVVANAGWRNRVGASSPAHSPALSPAHSPSPSAHSSPRAMSATPPPIFGANGRPGSPTLSLSTHIEPRYPAANFSPSREQGDSERRRSVPQGRPLELRQPKPRRPNTETAQQTLASSPVRDTMTEGEKKSINDIVRAALRPHWRAQKITGEQYAVINKKVSRKLYGEVKDASKLLDDDAKQAYQQRACKEVDQEVTELKA